MGIHGGRNAFTEDVLERVANKGNQRAQKLLQEWRQNKED